MIRVRQKNIKEDPVKEETELEKNLKRSYRRGLRKGIICTAAIAVAVFVLAGPVFALLEGGGLSYRNILTFGTTAKVNMLASYIEKNYYEKVDTKDLKNGLYDGLFESLDVYSRYYTASEYKELYEDNISGSFYGIGAGVKQDEDTKKIYVVSVYSGSPAKKAGLKVGDVLVSADGYKASSMTLSEFTEHLHGKKGTTVKLTVSREGLKKNLVISIKRENIVAQTVAGKMLDNKIGYIAISEFTDNTTAQFTKQLNKLKKQGMTSLVVDLRSNPGGMLTSVCAILDEILPKGLMVYTQERDGTKEKYMSDNKEVLKVPIAVLVNKDSASASEIFAGAIKDRNYGTIIGTTTYGKGVVQTIHQFSDGSALKLTTARYFTPSGICIQGIGITPDIRLSYKFQGTSKQEYTWKLDNQILKACDVLKKELEKKK